MAVQAHQASNPKLMTRTISTEPSARLGNIHRVEDEGREPDHGARRYLGQQLNALCSARDGRPIGFGFGTFIEVAHWIASSHKGYLRAFQQALEAYGRAEQLKAEDHTGKWRDKVSLYKPKLQATDTTYASINPYPELTSFLFPEVR